MTRFNPKTCGENAAVVFFDNEQKVDDAEENFEREPEEWDECIATRLELADARGHLATGECNLAVG
jgi:hypothetical protein